MNAFYQHMAAKVALTPGLPTLSAGDLERLDVMLEQAKAEFREAPPAANRDADPRPPK